MADRTCSIDGCGSPHLARGMCSKHYQSAKARGIISNLPRRTAIPCKAEGCTRLAEKREWCNRHYRRMLTYGTLQSPSRPEADPDWLASIDVPLGARAVPVLISVKEGFTYALVDEADFANVSQWRWRITPGGYATSTGASRNTPYMHRIIMGAPDGLEIDHINRMKLDNRRCNLRAVDRSLNSFNQSPSRANTSGHRGVGYFKPAKLWRAYITHKSQPQRIELGYFKTKEEAVAARKAAEEKYFGECA